MQSGCILVLCNKYDEMRRVMLLVWDVRSRWWRSWLGPVQAQLIRLDS